MTERKPASTRWGRYKDPKPPAALRTITGYASGIAVERKDGEALRHAVNPNPNRLEDIDLAMCGVVLRRRRFSPFQLGHPRSCRRCQKAIQ